jgi:hypothetical protein
LREKGGSIMFYAALYKMLCMAYGQLLRALVKKAIDDPDSEIDDIALSILDKLFNYEGE